MATAITLLACLVALMAATVLAQNAPGPTTPTLTAGKATAPFNTSVTGAPTGGFGVSIQTVTLGKTNESADTLAVCGSKSYQ